MKPEHFLETIPFDWTRPESQELRNLLSGIYYKTAGILRLVQEAGIPPGTIHWDQPADLVWQELLDEARNRNRLIPLIERVIHDPAAVAYRERLEELRGLRPSTEAPAPRMRGRPPARDGGDASRERILGRRDSLLHISILEHGARLARGVARLRVWFGEESHYGTACLIEGGLLLTNHHVLFDWSREDRPPTRVQARFRYEVALDGQPCAVHDVDGDVATIQGQKRHDWATISVPDLPRDEYPQMSLGSRWPVEPEDTVFIIQHPDGGPKKIGLSHNTVSYVDRDVVQYLADTKGGSSGSPVFNERWEVVALHSGCAESAATADGGREYRNEGIRIERILEGMKRV